MNLPLHQILPSEPVPLYHQHFDDGTSIMASCRIPSSSGSSSAYLYHEEEPATQVRIHSIYPLSKLKVCEKCPPNVVSVHPYGKTNLLFMVLGQEDRKGKRREGSDAVSGASIEASNACKVALWNDKTEEVVLELVFGDPVINVILRRDKLVVVLERRIVLFNLDLGNKDRAEAVVREGQYETYSNPLGLASIATETGSTMLAFPARQAGHVQLVRLPRLREASEPARPPKSDHATSTSSAPPYPAVHIFVAHESPLRTLTLSSTGSLLCTSSAKGTLLRVFSTSAKALVRELRRGSDQADIWSAAFLHPDRGELIACASDKRTVHVWKVGDLSSDATPSRSHSQQSSAGTRKPKEKDTTKAFNLLKPYLPAYFSSQWSDLTWRIPHNASTTFHPAHVAALAEQDDIATCLFVRNSIEPVTTPVHLANSSNRNGVGAETTEHAGEPFYLLIITRSGAWYKLSTTPQSISSASTRGGISNSAERQRRVTIQDDKDGTSTHLRSSAKTTNTRRDSNDSSRGKDEDGKKCHMVEYRRIGYGSDGEEEEDEDDISVFAEHRRFNTSEP